MKFARTACRIAWRELRASPSRFLFVIVAVAVGVGALSGVKGFGAAFRGMLLHNAKQLTASDLAAQVWSVPSPDQLRRLRELGLRNGQFTWVTETVSMAAPAVGGIPQMVAVKAVDPSLYPFYGQLTLNPDKPLSELLSRDSVVVNNEFLIRMRARAGDMLRLGGRKFRIAAVVVMEPDRLASGFGPGMRVMMTREALDSTGLLQFGSRAAERFLFKLRPGANIDQMKASLEQILVRPRLTDYRDGDPALERGIDNSTTFLSLVSLIALIVGSLGVGMAMHSHIQQRMDTIAVMKAIGGRSRQIMTIYLIQTLWLGLAGGLIGVAIGAVVQRSFPILMHRVFDMLPDVAWDWSFSLQGLALGILATLLFTLPPLLSVRGVRPSLVFRREMEEVKAAGLARWLRMIPATAAGVLLLAGLAGIAVWLSGSWKMGAYFVGGLVVSLLLLAGAASALLWVMRKIVRGSGRRLPASFRHGFANLYRPGTHAASVLVALGIGVMFTLTTWLIQQTVLREVTSEGPGRAGNVFLLDVRPSLRDEVSKFVATQPGVNGKVELVGYFVARTLSLNGTPVDRLPLTKRRRDQLENSRLSTVETLPSNCEIKAGHFWGAGESSPEVAVSEDHSIQFGIHIGGHLQFQAAGRTIEAPVVAVFRIDRRSSFRFDLLFPREAANGIPAVYYGAVHVEPDRIPALELALFDRYPTVTVMNLADILTRIQEAVDQVALVIRFLAAFAILAGVIILSSSIAGTRYRRLREVAILKTLGATRRRISGIFSIEFSILGLVAGLIGGLLANAFTRVIAQKFIEAKFDFDWPSLLVAMLGTALLANGAGWLASMRILGQRPLEVLRGE